MNNAIISIVLSQRQRNIYDQGDCWLWQGKKAENLIMFIHNSRSKHRTSITLVRLRRILAFNFDCRVQSLCAIVNFLVLDVFNINGILRKAVVVLKPFYPLSGLLLRNEHQFIPWRLRF